VFAGAAVVGGAVVGGTVAGGAVVVVGRGRVVVVVGAAVVVVVGAAVVVVVVTSARTVSMTTGRAGWDDTVVTVVEDVAAGAAVSTASAEDRSGRLSSTTTGIANMLAPTAKAARRRSIEAHQVGGSAPSARCLGRGRTAVAVGKRAGRYEARAVTATRAQYS
jgi:hypothetical protein